MRQSFNQGDLVSSAKNAAEKIAWKIMYRDCDVCDKQNQHADGEDVSCDCWIMKKAGGIIQTAVDLACKKQTEITHDVIKKQRFVNDCNNDELICGKCGQKSCVVYDAAILSGY
jgi:hypothetical protein